MSQAQKRLQREYKMIQKNPPPYIIAKPDDENILEWHYVITGPPNTCYEGGQYHGTLIFQRDYPFKPPAIRMITPNGRFKTNTRLCLSMSDFHPDLWNPAWSVSTILTGLLSFMTGDESTTGSINTTVDVRKKLAKDSKKWNNYDAKSKFPKLFPDVVKQNLEEIAKVDAIEAKREKLSSQIKSFESVADVKYMDPEDRLMASALKERNIKKDSRSGSSKLIVSMLIILVVAMGSKLIKS